MSQENVEIVRRRLLMPSTRRGRRRPCCPLRRRLRDRRPNSPVRRLRRLLAARGPSAGSWTAFIVAWESGRWTRRDPRHPTTRVFIDHLRMPRRGGSGIQVEVTSALRFHRSRNGKIVGSSSSNREASPRSRRAAGVGPASPAPFRHLARGATATVRPIIREPGPAASAPRVAASAEDSRQLQGSGLAIRVSSAQPLCASVATAVATGWVRRLTPTDPH